MDHTNSESGFFHLSWHADTCGLGMRSSLSTPEGVKQIQAYNAPMRCQDIVARVRGDSSKYGQIGFPDAWHGVVLAGQTPHDKVIKVASGQGFDYWGFLEDACCKFGKSLLLKIHPLVHDEEAERHESIAKRYGSRCGHFRLNCIRDCRFVLLYNSTFAVDAWLCGKPVVQYAPGYFSGTQAVTFTNGRLVDSPEDCGDMPQKVLDFLAWRYCWRADAPESWKQEIEAIFENPTELFPLPERLSYAAFIRKCIELGDTRYLDIPRNPMRTKIF